MVVKRRQPAGSLQTEPVSDFDHLPLVPGVGENLSNPHLRNHLLLRAWEGDVPSSIPTPHGSVYLSKKCADSPAGLAFVAALIHAAVLEAQLMEEEQ